jgi:hypothetical protein
VIDPRKFAQDLVSGAAAELGEAWEKPPCLGGPRTKWTCAILGVLEDLGLRGGYRCYPWLLDFVWWDQDSQSMIMGAECEWAPLTPEEDDFQKLVVFKCPLKLFVFSGDPEIMKQQTEKYLEAFSQHVRDEEYVLVGFSPSGPRTLFFKVPNDGKLTWPVRFIE